MNDAQHRRRKKKHYLHREERPSLTRQVYVNNSCGRSYAAICCKSGLRSYTTITLLAPESLYLPSSSQHILCIAWKYYNTRDPLTVCVPMTSV